MADPNMEGRVQTNGLILAEDVAWLSLIYSPAKEAMTAFFKFLHITPTSLTRRFLLLNPIE